MHEKSISIASLWEMAIKHSLGKLALAEPFDILIPREIRSNGFQLLPIELAHLTRVNVLPFHHRDPFDRLLIAQSLVESLTIVSIEVGFDAYGAVRLW